MRGDETREADARRGEGVGVGVGADRCGLALVALLHEDSADEVLPAVSRRAVWRMDHNRRLAITLEDAERLLEYQLPVVASSLQLVLWRLGCAHVNHVIFSPSIFVVSRTLNQAVGKSSCSTWRSNGPSHAVGEHPSEIAHALKQPGRKQSGGLVFLRAFQYRSRYKAISFR
eukprot:1708281-Pyramimonas_sp.AAC.1